MTTVGSADYSSLLTQVQGLTSQASGAGAAGNWYNAYSDIWTYYNTLQDGDNAQKAQATQTMVQKAVSWIQAIQANRAAEAAKKSSENAKKSQQVENEHQQTETQNNNEIQDVQNEVDTNQQQVEEIQEQVTEEQEQKDDLAG